MDLESKHRYTCGFGLDLFIVLVSQQYPYPWRDDDDNDDVLLLRRIIEISLINIFGRRRLPVPHKSMIAIKPVHAV